MGGIRHTTGEPDRPPARTGISIGDSLAGLFAVIGTLAALHERHRSGRGQEVDVAIYEAVMALMESTVADYELGGVVRTRSGGILRDVAPANAYPTADGHDVVIAGERRRGVRAPVRWRWNDPDLATDARVARGRGPRARTSSTTRSRRGRAPCSAADLIATLAGARGAGRADQPGARPAATDPHIAAREMIVRLAAGFDRPSADGGRRARSSRARPGAIRARSARRSARTPTRCSASSSAVHAAEIAALRDAGVVA